MNLFKIFSVIIIVIRIEIYFTEAQRTYLRFHPHPLVSKRLSSYELTKHNVIIDAYRKSTVLIKIIKSPQYSWSARLDFYCHVKSLNVQHAITEAQLCHRSSMVSKEYCKPIQSLSKSINLPFSLINFDPLQGYQVSIKGAYHAEPIEGLYSCKLTNRLGSIQSNSIEIFDNAFFKRKILEYPTSLPHYDLKMITSFQLPMYIPCKSHKKSYDDIIPENLKSEITSPYQWNLCVGATSMQQCTKKIYDRKNLHGLKLDDIFQYEIFLNGTIVLLNIKKNIFIKAGLACTSHHDTANIYAIYMTKSENKWDPIMIFSTPNKRKLHVLSPVHRKYILRESTYASSRFELFASYVYDIRSSLKTSWRKVNGTITKHFKILENKLIFPRSIKQFHAGRYTFELKEKNNSSKLLIFDIQVLTTPRFLNHTKLPTRIIISKLKPFVISATFAETDTNIGIEINGHPINLSENSFEFNRLIYKYPQLNGLSFQTQQSIDGPSRKLTCTVDFKLKTSGIYDENHSLSFIGRNSIGESRVDYLLEYYEQPTFLELPSHYDCGEGCFSLTNHIIGCRINDEYYKRNGFIVDYHWIINSVRLTNHSSFKNHMNVFKNKLVLFPSTTDQSKTDDNIAETLANSTIYCHIIVSYVHQSRTKVFFDSDKDKKIKNELTVKFQMTYKDMKMDTFWIYFLIGLFLYVTLTAAIATSLRYYFNKQHSEKYKVSEYELEEIHGMLSLECELN